MTDLIRSMKNTDAYRDGWDRVFGKKDNDGQGFTGSGGQTGTGAQAVHGGLRLKPRGNAVGLKAKVRQLATIKAPPRNSACVCGSGKKYKHCHGAPPPLPIPDKLPSLPEETTDDDISQTVGCGTQEHGGDGGA